MSPRNSTTKTSPKVQGKLGQGPPDTVHARVSMAVAWERLEALDALAVGVNAAKIKEWSEQFWLELQECRIAI